MPSPTEERRRPGLFVGIGAFLAGSAVALGALGAHALADVLGADMETYRIAMQYQLVHGVALTVVGVLLGREDRAAYRLAGWLFVAGTVLFSGSLYLLTLRGPGPYWPLTPAGGVTFVVGWLTLAWGALVDEDADDTPASRSGG